ALLESREQVVWPSNALAYEKDRAATLRALGDARFESLRDSGASVSTAAAIDSTIAALQTVLAGAESRLAGARRTGNTRGADLTAREREVVRLVLRGMTNR